MCGYLLQPSMDGTVPAETRYVEFTGALVPSHSLKKKTGIPECRVSFSSHKMGWNSRIHVAHIVTPYYTEIIIAYLMYRFLQVVSFSLEPCTPLRGADQEGDPITLKLPIGNCDRARGTVTMGIRGGLDSMNSEDASQLVLRRAPSTRLGNPSTRQWNAREQQPLQGFLTSNKSTPIPGFICFASDLTVLQHLWR